MSKMVENLSIFIQYRTYKATGLIVAYSNDLRGLLVSGRTEDEVSAKLPGAIREILEAQGKHVLNVKLIDDSDGEPKGFEPRGFIAAAELAAA